MKKIFFLALIFFLIPFSNALAHGGVQDSAGNVTATFFQAPFAPIIGKSVALSFILTDKDSNKRLINYPGVLVIKETFYGDEAQDITLLTKNVKSDVNGEIALNYVFTKDKIYDIEITFPKVKDPENSVGFLLQPRPESDNLPIIGAGILGFVIGYFLLQKRKKII